LTEERSAVGDVLSVYVPAFFIMVGISIVSPILSVYARSFGVSYTLASLVISMYALGRLVMDLPVGVVADRVGRRPVLLLGATILSAFAFLNGLARGFWELVLYRFLQGIGSSMWMTSRSILLADILRPEERGRVLGYFQAFMLLGASAGPTVGGIVAAAWGVRGPFFVYGLFGLLSLGLSLFLVHEPGADQVVGRVKTGDRYRLSPGSVRRLLENPSFSAACLATFTIFFLRTGVRSTMIPLYAGDALRLDEVQIGFVISLSTVMNLAVVIPIGHLLDRYGRKIVILSTLLLTGLATLTFPFTTNVSQISLSCLFLGVGTGGGGQVPMALAADATVDEPHGLSMGLYRLFGDVGFVLGPIVLGLVADTLGLKAPFFAATLLVVSSAALVQVFAGETLKRPA